MDQKAEQVEGPKAEAGWYPDPGQAGTQRYWDGEAWTEQRAPMPPSQSSPLGRLPIGVWIAAAGVLLTVVSVFLPYLETTTFGGVTDNNLIQHTEGVVILILALVAALALYRRVSGNGWRWSVGALGAVILAIAIMLIANPPELRAATVPEGGSVLDELRALSATETASPGVGVYAAALGGLLILAGGFRLRPRSTTGEAAR